MDVLIFNHSKNNLKNQSIPAQTSIEQFTQTSTHIFNQLSTKRSTQTSSFTILKNPENLFEPYSTK